MNEPFKFDRIYYPFPIFYHVHSITITTQELLVLLLFLVINYFVLSPINFVNAPDHGKKSLLF